jgi:uncharacterized coiled-coil protein SlyX
MSVDALWDEVLQSLDDKPNPSSAAGKHLRRLIESPDGQARFRRGIKEKLKQKKLQLLRLFAQLMDPVEQPGLKLSKEMRRDLLGDAVDVAAVFAEKDAVFWRIRWLQLASGQLQVTPKLSQELHTFGSRCGTAGELVKKFTGLSGWTDFPKDRWVELIDKAKDAGQSVDFRSQLQKVVHLLRGEGGDLPPKPDASPTPPAVVPMSAESAPTGPRAAEPKQAATVSQPATRTEGGRPDVVVPQTESKPTHDVPTRGGEPPVPNAADTSKPGSGLPQPTELPAPAALTPKAAGEVGTAPVEAPGEASAGVRQDAGETKESRPKRATAKKTANKESPKDDGLKAAESPEPPKHSAGDQPVPGAGGQLPAVLADLASAVRAISGRLDQIASRTGDGASLEQRLVELERRLAGVERALTESQTDAQRSREESDRLRDRIRDREEELTDARRERDEAAARADELARRLAAADARINAAESRADQNIHEAFRERDAAVLTFKSRLWDAVQAQLSDVTDPTPGEEFESTLEEVLTTRLRSIRDALRGEGIPP